MLFRAYDATWAIAEAIKKSAGETSPTELFKGILSRKF